MQVLVIGASRGIGLEFVRQYRADGAAVRASARDDAGLARLRELGAAPLSIDIADAQSPAKLAQQMAGTRFDVAIVNAGVYGPRGLDAPNPPGQSDFDAVMHTNVLGAMRVVAPIADVLAPNAVLAVISSRMGSIGLRTASGGWLYRASKAALNSVLKDAAIVLQGRAICIAFHPGWVRTDMGGAGADLSVEQSVSDMRRTIATLTPQHNGMFLNHDGKPIDW